MSAVMIAASTALIASSMASSGSSSSADMPIPLAAGLMVCCFLLLLAMMFGLAACMVGYNSKVVIFGKQRGWDDVLMFAAGCVLMASLGSVLIGGIACLFY